VLLYNIIYISLLQRLLGIKSPLIVAGGKKIMTERSRKASAGYIMAGQDGKAIENRRSPLLSKTIFSVPQRLSKFMRFTIT
jgi:hypothetical protein